MRPVVAHAVTRSKNGRALSEESGPVNGIALGTSSWSTPGWVGPFYPKACKPADFLAHYATQFQAVEADVTYYRIPTPAMVANWRDRTPEGFSLCAKFPRSIVHAGQGPRPDASKILVPSVTQADTDAFLNAMAALGDRCGALLLQFPYLSKACFEDSAEFLDRLDAYLEALPATFRYAVEVRNKAWVTSQLTAVLRRHRVALVLVEMGYLPHPADVAAKLDVVTADFLYGRLIGDRKQVEARTQVFDKLVFDRTASLKRWADLMGALSERVPQTWLFANNHYAGHGPETIRELGRLMGLSG